jgi:metallophosphoesterase (TIGR00282 family)
MKILYLGDIMGRPGRETVAKLLPEIIKAHDVDFVIAQGENLSSGKGMQVKTVEEMLGLGINFFTGGNWTANREEINPWLLDATKPVIGPANMKTMPGKGWKIVKTPFGNILIASLLGQTVGYIEHEIDNPLRVIDAILDETKHEKLVARIVNFHGDYSSEKFVIGQYLDGKVSAVIGDHWHIPTADAMVLAGGTAHITDVGMVGSLDSCLGVETDIILKRWHDGHTSRNELETGGRMQLNGVVIDVDNSTALAKKITPIRQII